MTNRQQDYWLDDEKELNCFEVLIKTGLEVPDKTPDIELREVIRPLKIFNV